MSDSLSPLETCLIQMVAAENWPGFKMDGLSVTSRTNTGAGRYSYLADGLDQEIADGDYAAQWRMIEMLGVSGGIGWVVAVNSGRIAYLEMFTFGNNSWDGVERDWRLV